MNGSIFSMVMVAVFAVSLSPARADPARVSRAKARFEAGETHYRLGQFKKALDEYQAALRLARRPSIVFNLAQCHRQLGQAEKALFFYRLYLSDWQRDNPGQPAPYRDEVKAHIERLSRHVEASGGKTRPRPMSRQGVLTLRGVPRGAQVFVDGVLRGRGPLSGALEVDPGTRRLEVTHPDFSPWEGVARLSAGQRQTVAVTMTKKGRSKVWLGVGIATAGLAVGAEVLGLVTMVKGNDLYDDDPKLADYRTASYVGHGLAGAFAVASAVSFVMYALSGPSGSSSRRSAGLRLLPTANGAVVTGRF